MADLIRRQAAIEKLRNNIPYMQAFGADRSIILMREIPFVDAVEVVRCGECKHRYVDGGNVRYNVCDLNHNKVQGDDWFCADGERNDG